MAKIASSPNIVAQFMPAPHIRMSAASGAITYEPPHLPPAEFEMFTDHNPEGI